jgi:hypothetical protein
MRYFSFSFLLLTYTLTAFPQRQLKGIVADSISGQALPFATIRVDGSTKTFISGINGQFVLTIPASSKQVSVSYVSYHNRTIPAASLNNNDTIFLAPLASTLGEVIVRPQTEKIKRIINAAVRNKPQHNPELYDLYQCNIYYKMKVDMVPSTRLVGDSSRLRRPPKASVRNKGKPPGSDTGGHMTSFFGGNNHLLLSETYSRRFYKRPQQLQDVVYASRFSGLKKTYFGNLVTDIIPFHVYTDYIPLGGNDYLNPIAKGWQQRYDFYLADEITDGNDTTFILTFSPKKKTSFKSLKGMVYINSDGYAISHFISTTTDTISHREIRFDQVYSRVKGKWFPAELNYDLIYGSSPQTQLFTVTMNGHSIVDAVSYTLTKDFKFNRAYSAKLHDSVDLRTAEDWEKFRRDSLTIKEKNTYRVVDSISEQRKLEKLITGAGKIALGRLPIGIIDVDFLRLLASNDYEGTRLGIGLYTNEKLSKCYSVGGWMGYGFKDKKMKFGLSSTFFVKGNKDNWLRLSYNDDYQNAGNTHLHAEIDRSGYRNWILAQVDRIKEYGLTAHTQRGYFEIEANGIKQELSSLFENNFQYSGKNYKTFNVQEVNIGLRYAYGEKRIPMFGNYFPISTKYPVIYFRPAFGTIKAGDYSAKYVRALAGVTYSKRLNRWGKDAYRLEAGFIHSFDDMPLSKSFLLASKGFRRKGLNYYAWGGFLTMRPYDFYSNSYVSFLYKHDFEKILWRTKFSKPYISIAHNMMYAGLKRENKIANAGIASAVSGYHESGILLNQLLQKNFFGLSYIYLNAGAFYHWTSSFDWKRNGLFVIGISTGF